MKLRLFVLLLLLAGNSAFANDTLKVMAYNLLKYGISMPGCTNPISTKNANLSLVIADYVPDIFVVNELAPDDIYANNILINALQPVNANFQRAALTNNATADETNMLYYNSQKLGLRSQLVLNHYLRDINVYTLYYLDANLPATQDTIFLHIIAVHLKAGNTSSDQTVREDQATTIMNYMNSLGSPANYLIMGDFNLYTSSENAYQLLINDPDPDVRFYDPVNSPGSWNSNSSFKAIHTQSTRLTSLADCGSSGGMDDRFDFILASKMVMQGLDRIQYLNGSYWAYGNDSNHYNQNINSPANGSVSGSVSNALYNVSDHLPITLKLQVDGNIVSREKAVPAPGTGFWSGLSDMNGTTTPSLLLLCPGTCSEPSVTVSISDVNGKIIKTLEFDSRSGVERYPIDTQGWVSGLYWVRVQVGQSYFACHPLIVHP